MTAMLHLFIDILRNSILITGLVIIMMMMIESLNIDSHGKFLNVLKGSRAGQVVLSALLGSIPGCMGGFATVSLYTHRMISFGALVAMMIASSGDEAFVMLAMIPGDAVKIFILLFILAVAVGLLVDLLYSPKEDKMLCNESFTIHEADCCESHDESDGHGHGRHLTLKRALMFAGVAVFITALASGWLEHEHAEEAVHTAEAGGINLLSEDWMNVMFSILSLAILAVLAFASDHFVEEHLWNHIVRKHLPVIFAWTFGVLAFVGIGLQYLDIASWISGNTVVMILLATAVGIIPESGPHMIFVTLYATGVVPLPVLLASCISQDGHACLPLIAETKLGFLRAKAVNCTVALAVGFISMLFI